MNDGQQERVRELDLTTLRQMPLWRLGILGGCALTVLGAFLPWASALGISAAGIEGDGIITAVVAVVGGTVLFKGGPVNGWFLAVELVLAAIVVAVAVYHESDPFTGSGVHLTLLAGLVWGGAVLLGWQSIRVRQHSQGMPGD